MLSAQGGFEMSDNGIPVRLAVYDISGGWARILSPLLFCRKIKLAPHTGLLVYGREYFWAGGIQKVSS